MDVFYTLYIILIILAFASIITGQGWLHSETDAIENFPIRSRSIRDAIRPPEVDSLWKKLHTAGHWASWGAWTCDALCGRGAYFRKRHCVPSDDFGIPVCKGKTVERSRDECKAQCPGLSEIRRKWIGPKLTDAEMHAHTKLLSSSREAFRRNVGGVVQMDCYNLLTAHFLSNYSRSSLYWEKNGQKLRFNFNRMTITDYSILAIANLETTDSGVYACKMQLTKSLHLTILVFSLIVVGQPYDFRVTANTALKVKCNSDVIGEIFPGLIAQWIVDKTEHVLKDYGSMSPEKINEAVITNFSENDTGLWMCVIKDKMTNRTWFTNAMYVEVVPNAFLAALRLILDKLRWQWILLIIGLLVGLAVLVALIIYFTRRTKRKRKQKLLRRLNDILKISAQIESDFGKDEMVEEDEFSSITSPNVIVKSKIKRSPKSKPTKAKTLKEKIQSALRKMTCGKRKIKPFEDDIAHKPKDEQKKRRKKRSKPIENIKRLRINRRPLILSSSESSVEQLGSSESFDAENYVTLARRLVTRRNIELKMEKYNQIDQSEGNSEN